MSIGFLAHAKCGGTIVLVPDNMSITAPVFSISPGGISGLILEVARLGNTSSLSPIWVCNKCGVTIDKETMAQKVSALCRGCNTAKVVGELFVTAHTPAACGVCLDKLDEDGGTDLRHLETSTRPKRTPMIDVLFSDFSI